MRQPSLVADEMSQTNMTDSHHVFVARQPIYDRNLDVIAYDMLFRSDETNAAGEVEAYQASAQVLLNTFVEIGLDKLIQDKQAFIRFSRGFLLLDYVKLFPADRIGIDVKDIVIGNDLIEAVAALCVQGYTIVLDDFIYQDELNPLIELADIIKLDVSKLERQELEQQVALLKPTQTKLLAQKIETQDDFTYCKQLGFDYFQGYFFCQPEVVKGHRMPTNRLALLQLLATLQKPDADFDEVEAQISKDASLSYRLLSIVNSSYYSRPTKIETLRQGLLYLGMKAITTTVSLLLLANVDDKPHELMMTAMIRAKMAERLGAQMGHEQPDKFFLVGLFAILDALMNRPMQELLQDLPLQDDITSALQERAGLLGTILASVMAYERGNWAEMSNLGLDENVIVTAYLDAVSWADEMNDILYLV